MKLPEDFIMYELYFIIISTIQSSKSQLERKVLVSKFTIFFHLNINYTYWSKDRGEGERSEAKQYKLKNDTYTTEYKNKTN